MKLGGGSRVLLIGDDPAVREGIGSMLFGRDGPGNSGVALIEQG
ncbi:hypothetical protein [Nonomuraea cypriaca]|nr:hypothetical protein [Nonomuraea cypriaca]